MLFFFFAISDEDKHCLDLLIGRLTDGDKDALKEIYRIAGGRMLSVAMGIMRNKFFAEDVLSESFVKIIRFCSTYKKGTNAYAWLCSIVKNTAYNKIKKEKIVRSENIEDFFNIADEKACSFDRETAIMVENALKQLSPRERTVIWLKYYNDMTVREIAQEQGIPKSSVQYTITLAEKKLREILGKK